VNFEPAYRGKRVFVTGHTGFKGSWLTEWLLALGADVTGYSLPPPTDPALFQQLGLERRITHIEADIRDLDRLSGALIEAKPEFVFHLAAQPLVRLSYDQPVETYQTNVMGTVHVLEALRRLTTPCAALFVTTDKCYQNREWLYAYREEDPLGGYDPYSSSKAAAEIAIAAYRQSYFNPSRRTPVKIASARAGNVIGGGDWAQDRIVPDSIRALQRGEAIAVRNKNSTRPWQHVLEPLSGYLALAAALASTQAEQLCSAFNFGPALSSNRSVVALVDEILHGWPGKWLDQSDANAPHEAQLLNLATDKAFHLLGWSPVWNFETTARMTVDWYRQTSELAEHDHEVFVRMTQAQTREYDAARRAGN
jgi:CDP-glucose 4,6-dehydratase